MKCDPVRGLALLLALTILVYCDPFVSLVEAHARPISRQRAAKLDVRNSLKRWDRPFGAVLRGAEAVGYHNDGQLSTRHLTDAAAQVTDSYTYDAFGVTLAQAGSTANAYLYTGEQLDPNVGFYYLRARYLNQTAGRFISTDSFDGLSQDPQSLHQYLYGHANPVTNRDPSGLSILGWVAAAIVLAILVATTVAVWPKKATPICTVSYDFSFEPEPNSNKAKLDRKGIITATVTASPTWKIKRIQVEPIQLAFGTFSV